MITFLLISLSAIGILLYRAILSLLVQIPDSNLDFNGFIADTGIDRISKHQTSQR